jgi:hypothetical protein
MFRNLLNLPRAHITNFEVDRDDKVGGQVEKNDTLEVIVRAGSKRGAMLTGRIQAAQMIPFREQSVDRVEQLDSMRFLNKWRITIQDQDSVAGRVQ